MKKSMKIATATFGIAAVIFTTHAFAAGTKSEPTQETIAPFPEETVSEEGPIEIIIETEAAEEVETVSTEEAGKTNEEINLLAIITMAEAEGESELGKRLVIDTVLNRVDSPHFPNTVRDVIYQKGHFSPIDDGRFDKCYVTDEIRSLVLEELESRTRSDVIYFRTKKYAKWGKPLFKEGAHYFSSH